MRIPRLFTRDYVSWTINTAPAYRSPAPSWSENCRTIPRTISFSLSERRALSLSIAACGLVGQGFQRFLVEYLRSCAPIQHVRRWHPEYRSERGDPAHGGVGDLPGPDPLH